MTQELKTLNHYPEFQTDAQINQVIHYVNTGIFPPGLTQRQQNRYAQKFNLFVVQFGLLRYRPNANINLVVCLNANKQVVMQNIFNNIRRGLGQGLASFYHQVCETHLNIKKSDTDEFLRRQGDYQLTRTPRRPRINKPIQADVPNQRWAADLVDVSTYSSPQNNNYHWIMVCVDYFSGKIFARGMTNKRGATMRTTFEAIMNANNTVPHIIQGDGEFSQGEFRASCVANGIRMIKTNPYSPTSNGKIERANREIRKLIRAGFVRNNNFRWSQHLADYVANINSQRRARSKQSPNDLWTQGYNPLPAGHVPAIGPLNDDSTLQERQDFQNEYLDRRTARMLQTGAVARRFHLNDLVRIRLENVSNRMRERTKSHMSINLNAVRYSPEIYSVTNIRTFHGPRPPEYYLRDAGLNLVMSGVTPKVFYGSDLLFVPPGSVNVSMNPATVDRANHLNRL
jgi:transposase InsO family protein